jgi:hypothetical protein
VESRADSVLLRLDWDFDSAKTLRKASKTSWSSCCCVFDDPHRLINTFCACTVGFTVPDLVFSATCALRRGDCVLAFLRSLGWTFKTGDAKGTQPSDHIKASWGGVSYYHYSLCPKISAHFHILRSQLILSLTAFLKNSVDIYVFK